MKLDKILPSLIMMGLIIGGLIIIPKTENTDPNLGYKEEIFKKKFCNQEWKCSAVETIYSEWLGIRIQKNNKTIIVTERNEFFQHPYYLVSYIDENEEILEKRIEDEEVLKIWILNKMEASR